MEKPGIVSGAFPLPIMSRFLAILTWLAFPVYVWQGLAVRWRTQRMLPAQGPVRLHVEGREPALSILVLGDSSAASVGVEQSKDGLADQLALIIAQRTGRAVNWRAAGFNSATSGQLRDHAIPNLATENWTHIVLIVGTNDTKNFHTLSRFKREFGGLLYAIRAKWPEARVIWLPAAEFSRLPALPALLGAILEIRAGEINRLGKQLCLERGAVPATRVPIEDPHAAFSSDGFHASERGYRGWAEHIADAVIGDTES